MSLLTALTDPSAPVVLNSPMDLVTLHPLAVAAWLGIGAAGFVIALVALTVGERRRRMTGVPTVAVASVAMQTTITTSSIPTVSRPIGDRVMSNA